MEYENALKFYLDAVKFSHEPTLDLMTQLCRRLGDPQKHLSFVHIAGTNGKGSCAAMLASVLEAAGRRTGRFTSPHLVDFRERIQINGVYINPESMVRLTARIARACEGLPPLSFFELVTALAFLYFEEENCDVVVLECGLGGRYDATNVIPAPLCSVIMPIGLDHTAVLGDSLSRIAGEKAGILRPGVPAVLAPQEKEALEVLRAAAQKVNSPLHLVDITKITPLVHSRSGQIFHYKKVRNIHLPLLGEHQLENAACVLEAARILALPEDAVRWGLFTTIWPCRFELVKKSPPFLLDGAHNPHGAAALVRSLQAYFPGKKFCFVLGVLQDKDWKALLPLVTPVAERILCITPDNPRALPAAELAGTIRDVPAQACDSLEQALDLALESGLPCCAFGSLYSVGYIRQILKRTQ